MESPSLGWGQFMDTQVLVRVQDSGADAERVGDQTLRVTGAAREQRDRPVEAFTAAVTTEG